MLHRNREKNITSGNLFLGIVRFAIPIFLSQLVQTLFTAADTAVVGNFTAGDPTAVASIGASNPVIMLLINAFVALGAGAGVVIAKAIGAKCVLVARGHQSRETLLTAGVPVVDTLQAAADRILQE